MSGTSVRATATLLLTLGLASTLWASDAAAQPTQPTQPLDPTVEARQRFEIGLRHFDAGDFNAAVAEFQRAVGLAPRASIYFNLGAAYRGLHRYPDALEAFRRALAVGGLPRAQLTQCEHSVTELEALVARVTVEVVPSEATVILDQRPLAPLTLVLVSPGEHHLEVTATGWQTAHENFTVTSGENRTLRIALARPPPVTPPPPHVPVPPIVPDPPIAVVPPGSVIGPPRPRAVWPWLAVGSAVLFAGAISFGIAALDAHGEFTALRSDDPQAQGIASTGRSYSIAADALTLGGIVIGTVSLVLAIRAARTPDPRHPAALRVAGFGAALYF